MQCLNVKNKEVAALLKQYTKILGNENAAYYVLSENNGYGLDKAPNGEPSKLFSDLLEHYNGDRVAAIQAKARTYSKSFKEWFGDWTGNVSIDIDSKDAIDYLYSTNTELSKVGSKEEYTQYVNSIYPNSLINSIYWHGTDSDLSQGIENTKKGKGSGAPETGAEMYFNKQPWASLQYLSGVNRNIPDIEGYNNWVKLWWELKEALGNGRMGTDEWKNEIIGPNTRQYSPNKRGIFNRDKGGSNGKYLSERKARYGYQDKTDKEFFEEVFDIRYGKETFNDWVNRKKSEFQNVWKSRQVKKGMYPAVLNIQNPIVEKNQNTYYEEQRGLFTKAKRDKNDAIVSNEANNEFGSDVVVIFNPKENVHFLGTKQDIESFKNWKSSNKDKTNVSKVVDENGEPLLVWHGTTENFDVFSKSWNGVIPNINSGKAIKENYEIVAREPNQIKSVDNQGTFSTQDNNIYNQKAATQKATGRNKELALLLQELYPNIEIAALADPNLRGQAQVEGYMAGRVLLNTLLENQDTLPHEYAHHYIAWFRNASIVQRGIKQFGSEESLVQAIGENSVKALKWYNRFFNWVKGLFNEKQDTLNEITKAFLSGHILDNSYFFGKEIHNQKVAEIPEAVNKVYDKLMESIKRRIKDIQYAKYSDSKKVDELRALEFKLNQLENDQATFEFVDYMASDIISALNEIKALQAKVKENQKYDNPLNVTSAELDVIKKGYIGFYGNIATNIQNMLDDESTFDYLNDPQLVEDTKQNLKRTVGDYYELVRNYNNLADIVAKDNFIREATKAGSFTIDHLKKILDEGDVDINLWDQWVGNTQYSNSELVRIILNKIVNTKNNVAEKELEVGKELLEILSHVDKSKLAYMHEKNKDGHKTGFITRDLNYGQHYQDYLEHQKKLAEKLGFGDKDIAEVPGLLNPEQLKKWNKANNDWEAKHTIRKFTPEYYELTNSLSEEARSRRDSINMEINLLLSTTVDKNGDYHREDLSDEDYLKLQELETRRRNLANPYYPDGLVKVGLDKEIAIEMREYNEKLREKLHYTPNMEKFNKALQNAKKNLSPEKFAKWEQRNTVDQIIEEFWDDIKTLSSNANKSDDQILYETARKNMLRLYTREDGKVDVDSMPDQVKSWINTYDELISEESLKTRDKSKKSKVMDIAEWEVNPRFYEELERVEKLGQAEYNAWVSINARYDYEGNLVPASFWKKLVPKKELRAKYMRKVPNRSWSEIDKESPFYDKRFTKYADRGETRIPNPELYDNSANYRKITSDSNLKKLYDKLVDVMELSNSKIQFLKYENKYRLPQIEGGAWTQIRSKDNILKGLAYAIKDTYTVKDDDNAYMLENAKRSDGSLVKLIPTRYIKMLSNPDALTNDIVGSVIAYYKMAENYEQMSEIAPELEVALDFVSRTDFTDKKGGRIQGLESKTYDKLKSVLDQLVYGMEKNALELDVHLPKDKHVTVSVGKLVANLAAYTRIQGISQNINVILTGLITNKIQNRLEAISGIYFGNKELAQATKLIIPSYANAIKNIGHSNNKNKVLCYMEYLGVVRENAQTFSKLNQSRFLRALNQHFWYFGHEISDYVTKGKMALAIGLYYKYDPESGKFLNKNEFLRRFKSKKEGNAKWNTLSVTFYDAFEVKNNKLVMKPEYAKSLDEATINKVRNTAKQVGTRIDMQLTDLDRSKLHATVIGQLLLIFRNFILVILQTKFLTKRQFNYSTGMWSEAQVPAAVKYVYRHYFNQNKIDQLKELYQNHYDELDDFEKGCLKRVTYEVLFSTVGFMIISSLMRAMADDDKRNWWKQEAAYLTLRASLETRGNILPIEVINLLNTPTAAWSTLQYWGDLTTMMLNDPTQEIKKGPYKSMNRFQRSLIKATPLRSIWEAQDPRSKMEYYDNMILIFNF